MCWPSRAIRRAGGSGGTSRRMRTIDGPCSGRPPTDPTASPTSGWFVAEANAPAPGAVDRATDVLLEHGSELQSTFAGEVSAAWRAGRGPHSGYLAAMLLRALIETVADP